MPRIYESNEQPACKTAIVQAMHYELQLERSQICRLMGVSSNWVGAVTIHQNDGCGAAPWWKRRFKAEAVVAAKEIAEALAMEAT